MKKRTAGILLGAVVTSMLLSGCGNNEAKEAANESAQVEEEGVGELTEEGEKVEAEVTGSAEKDTDSDSAESSDSTQEDTAEEESDSETETKEPEGIIGVLLPENDDNAAIDEEEMTQTIAEGGYEAKVKNAEGNSSVQISQIQEFIDEQVSAMIIDPVDPYALKDVLEIAKENSIPVISYDKLICDTADVNYYASYDTRAIGQEIAKEIVKKMDLDKARDDKKSYTIEFLMGSPDDNGALFLNNGIMEVLQEYLDDGTLICKSGLTAFDDTGIMRWSENSARERMESIISEFYTQEKTPDIICTAYDGFTYAVQDVLKEQELVPGSEEWPMITGYGSEAQAVKDVAEEELSFTTFMDRKELAQGGAQMTIDYLTGEKVDVKDYSKYDNGVKIVGTFTCTAQIIDKDNYQILVDNGTYTEDEIKPDPTPTPTPVPETTSVPQVTEAPEDVQTSSAAEKLTENEQACVTPQPTQTSETTVSEQPTSTPAARVTLKQS